MQTSWRQPKLSLSRSIRAQDIVALKMRVIWTKFNIQKRNQDKMILWRSKVTSGRVSRIQSSMGAKMLYVISPRSLILKGFLHLYKPKKSIIEYKTLIRRLWIGKWTIPVFLIYSEIKTWLSNQKQRTFLNNLKRKRMFLLISIHWDLKMSSNKR